MANWNEGEYVARSKEIAQQFMVSKKPLNDIAEKYARDNALNPEEIRTLVRLANVATFREVFDRKAGDSDRMVDFEVGEPEAVIRRIVDSASQPQESANIMNDKLAFEVPDMMREKRLGQKFDVYSDEKTASEDAPEKLPRKDMVILNLEKLASDFEVERLIEGKRWEDAINKLAAEFKKAPGYGPNFQDFEKDAYAVFGTEIRAEIAELANASKQASVVLSDSDIQFLGERRITRDTPTLELLKEAVEARNAYAKYVGGLTWIKNNMPVITL